MNQLFIDSVIEKLNDPHAKFRLAYTSIITESDNYEVTCCDDRIYIRSLTSPVNTTTLIKLKGVINKWRYRRAWHKRFDLECVKCL